MSEPFIVATNLSKTYRSGPVETAALRGLNLTIQQGEVVAIIGASGSGKSTFLNLLGGLDRPSGGSLCLAGLDLATLPEESLVRYRRQVVGFVWQQMARNMLPYLSARQNVMLPMKLRGAGHRAQRERAEELLTAVNIAHRADHRTEMLSGGEQQRVAIAVALANRPGLLLADEPTGSVDTQTTADLVDLFRTLAGRYGVTIVIVTHDVDVAAHVDRAVIIQDGQIQAAVNKD